MDVFHPQFQCVPVDARDDSKGHQRMTKKFAESGTGRQWLRHALQRGNNQLFGVRKAGIARVVVVNLGKSAPGNLLEAEPIVAFYFAERRDVKYFSRGEPVIDIDRSLVVMGDKLVVTVAESIADLGERCT